ncbi:hypothetical protein M2372_003555 [Chryseobacterium sp. BIGb0232]|nr:hypothetical protein [Chryseobacterium sp. BIGb0232]ROS17670.1 hypothetical protein EDF65_2048 [Chryseobacterium nakagawai]
MINENSKIVLFSKIGNLIKIKKGLVFISTLSYSIRIL